MTHSSATAIILAAGESRRMGVLKPLLPLGEKPVLERVVDLFQASGISDIRVVTGHRGEEIRQCLPSLRVEWIHNTKFPEGMFSSIKKGLENISPSRACFFLMPADIPLVRSHTLSVLQEKWETPENGAPILYPTFMGKRGHPPLISTRYIPEIMMWNRPGGLRVFLERNKKNAVDIPVIDEYILKDMDTRPDYEHIVLAWRRYDIPTAAECMAMLNNPVYFSRSTAAHCRAVARLAVYLGRKLADRNSCINLERISASALLHDVSKGHPFHARAGADLLSKLGFSGIADIVSGHMDIALQVKTILTDREVVYLADKLVKEDKLVPLSVRFEDKLARHGHDPAARAAILKRKADTLAIVRLFEKECGTLLQKLLDEYVRNP